MLGRGDNASSDSDPDCPHPNSDATVHLHANQHPNTDANSDSHPDLDPNANSDTDTDGIRDGNTNTMSGSVKGG